MQRFIGMMLSKDVEREEQFRVGDDQLTVGIQAGTGGWTVIYNDGSTEYKDEEDTTDNNFEKALTVLKSHFENVNPVKSNKTDSES